MLERLEWALLGWSDACMTYSLNPERMLLVSAAAGMVSMLLDMAALGLHRLQR